MEVSALLNERSISSVNASGSNANAGRMSVSHSQSLPPVSATLLWNQRSGAWEAEFRDRVQGRKTVGIDQTSQDQVDRLSREESLQGWRVSVYTKAYDQGQSDATFDVQFTSIRLDTASFDRREDTPFADFIRSHRPEPGPFFPAWSSLPPELKLDVLDHLSFADKRNLRHVDRAWYLAGTSSLKHVNLKIAREDTLGDLEQVLRGGNGMIRLDVAKITLSDKDSAIKWVKTAEVKKIAQIANKHAEVTEFDASNCRAFTNAALGALKPMTRLQKLTLSHCDLTDGAFRHFRAEGNGSQPFPHLTHLDVSNCGRITTIDNIQQLRALEHLNLDYCMKVNNVAVLETMQLKTLSAKSVPGLAQGMMYLKAMQGLTYLDMDGCRPPENQLQVLQHLAGLEHLDLSHATLSPGILKHVGALQNLKVLRLFLATVQTSALRHLESLSGTLEKLDLSFLKSADGNRGRFAGLAQFSNLRALSLSNSHDGLVQDLSDVQQLEKLEYLNISGWPGLTDDMVMEHVLQLQNLTCLVVNECTELTEASFRCFKDLPRLEILSIRGCNVPDGLLNELISAIPNVITETSSMAGMP